MKLDIQSTRDGLSDHPTYRNLIALPFCKGRLLFFSHPGVAHRRRGKQNAAQAPLRENNTKCKTAQIVRFLFEEENNAQSKTPQMSPRSPLLDPVPRVDTQGHLAKCHM